MSSTRSMSTDYDKQKNDAIIIERLLKGAYHLPGNSYMQDLFQYFGNTHPLFGIFFHSKLHPIGWKLRVAFLIGSVAFGLAVTNIVYVAFVIDDGKYDATYYSVQLNQTVTGNDVIDSQLTQVNVTNGMIVLWTLGAALNALYDLTIWTIASCQCLSKNSQDPNKNRLRLYLVLFLILAIVTGSTLAVLVRATYESNQQTETVATSLELRYTANAESYRFLLAYFVELALSLLVWNFVVGFVLFSGVLGCWCQRQLPVLGGRPYEIRMLEEQTKP